MKHIYDDGGRSLAGYQGHAGDCVARSIAIAAGLPYAQVYEALANGTAKERRTKRGGKLSGRKTARNGIHVSRRWFKAYMASLGFTWTPTMGIGTGCKVHLHDGELPMGRLVVSVSKHYTAVIDGEVHDTWDPQRAVHWCHFNGASSSADPRCTHTIQCRCVYGYYTFTRKVQKSLDGAAQVATLSAT